MLGTQLLNLRRNKTSTVAALISGMERLATARSQITLMTRSFALNDLVDAVLAQVAVHALEASWGHIPLHKHRRASIWERWRVLHHETGRRLFASSVPVFGHRAFNSRSSIDTNPAQAG